MSDKMTDQEALSYWGGLEKRHRAEIASAVARITVGRSMSEVARLLGRSLSWVQDQLDCYAVTSATGGDRRAVEEAHQRDDIRRVVADYAPAQVSAEYVAEYEIEGHTPEVSKRLARSYQAAEQAIAAGVIQESVSKQNERVAKIILPRGADFALDLEGHMARVKAAAHFLDDAQIADLRSAITLKKVGQAHARWTEQIERIQNLHGEDF